jgi:energy-coupling factor transport system ATP-binding protein
VIRLSNIFYRYPGTFSDWVLEDLNLKIHEGEYVLLCGGSGSGKSTLGYLLNGLIPHFFGGTLKGTVSVCGRDTLHLTVGDLLPTVGLVFQNPDAQLFNGTVASEIAFGLESLGRSPREIDRQIARVAEALNIEHLLERSPTALSGGEKRLVAIASVLCLDPPLLVLDEPHSHLDWEGARRVRTALKNLHQAGKTVVVIEQRVGAVLRDADRCVVMDHGTVLFDGIPATVGPVLREVHLIPDYPAREERTRPSRGHILSAQDINFTMDDGRRILERVSVNVQQGEILSIVGRNGSGKTTLVKNFNGLLQPDQGKVLLMGEGIRGMSPPEIATRVGVAFQNPNDQFFKYTVKDELLIGLKLAKEETTDWLAEVCTLFDLHKLLNQSPYRLSEGQKKRVGIASVVVMRPQILILDEPTVGQDGRFRESLASLLLSLQAKGITVVIVTHDLEFSLATSERWIVMHDGRIAGVGSPQALARNEALIRMGALGQEDWVTMGGLPDGS